MIPVFFFFFFFFEGGGGGGGGEGESECELRVLGVSDKNITQFFPKLFIGFPLMKATFRKTVPRAALRRRNSCYDQKR